MTRPQRLALGYLVVTLVYAGWLTVMGGTHDVAPFLNEWYGPSKWERLACLVLQCILAIGIPAYVVWLAFGDWRRGRRAAAGTAWGMSLLTVAVWMATIFVTGSWY